MKRVASLKSTFFKKKIKIILSILVIVSICITVNSLTYKQFIFLFKGIMSNVNKQGNTGTWDETIQSVKTIGIENISVEGYPDSKVFLYGTNERRNQQLVVYSHCGG